MSLRRSIKTWDSKDKLLLSFFGFDLSHPEEMQIILGSGIRVPKLSERLAGILHDIVGDEGDYSRAIHEREMLTTKINLTCVLGYADAGIKILRSISQEDPGLAPEFMDMYFKRAEQKFTQLHLEPLREYLWSEWKLYFHFIPASSTETHLETGELFRSVGPPVLCFLPASPRGAQKLLSTTEMEMKLIAGQAVYLVRRQCDVHRIRRPEQLIEALNEWPQYIDPFTMISEARKFERCHPHLMSPEAKRVLLPERASRLLRMAEQGYLEEGQHEE